MEPNAPTQACETRSLPANARSGRVESYAHDDIGLIRHPANSAAGYGRMCALISHSPSERRLAAVFFYSRNRDDGHSNQHLAGHGILQPTPMPGSTARMTGGPQDPSAPCEWVRIKPKSARSRSPGPAAAALRPGSRGR